MRERFIRKFLNGLTRDKSLGCGSRGDRFHPCLGSIRNSGANSGGFGLRISRIVVLTEHLHIAAQGQAAEAVFGFAPLELEERPRNFPRRKRNSKLEEVKADVKLLARSGTASSGYLLAI